MMRQVLLLLLVWGSLAAGVVVAAPSQAGGYATHLALVQSPIPPLPNEPLLLTRQATGLVWVNSTNTVQRQLTTTASNGNAIVSPDGAWVVYDERANTRPTDTFIIPAKGGTPRAVTVGHDSRAWSFDSAYLSFEAYNNESYNVYTYDIATGQRTTIETNAQDNHAWHPQNHQIYTLPYISEEDVSLYRSNPDGSVRTPVLETPDTEWQFRILPDGRVLVSAYNPTRYIITRVNADGSNPTVLKDLPRGVIVVDVSPYGTGFFYELDDALYLDDSEGQAVQQLTPPCAAPNGNCARSLVQWRSDGGQIAFRWGYLTPSGYTYTLYTLDQTATAPPRVVDSGVIGWVRYSPDGRYLAYQKEDDLIIYDIVAGQPVSTLPDTDMQMWRP